MAKRKYKRRGDKNMSTAQTVINSFIRDNTLESSSKVIRGLVFVFQGTIKSIRWVVTDGGVCEISLWSFNDSSFISYSRFVSKNNKVNISIRVVE